jgi:chemotaxis protein methyltransferase CheR
MTAGFAEPPELTAAQRDRLLALVDKRFGIRGSDYGASRIDAAVQKVLPRSGCKTVCDLLSALDEVQNPRWLYELVESLTVGETYFLRDGTQIAALRETVLPEAIRRRLHDKRLRVWSAGCSTGEEVYTLAILLKERNLPADWELTLLGTDVNRESLRVAREATYPAWSFRATPPAIRDRYFDSDCGGGTWRVKEPLRRMARFGWTNLGADPMMAPLADIDLVICRNVTIYFDDPATQRLYRALIRSLAPGGWLVLGSSDPIPADRELLERVEVADTVLWRRLSEPSHNRPKTPPRTVVPLGGRTRQPAATAKRSSIPEQRADDLEMGLLALESGSTVAAIESLRRATFRDASSVLAQFALARAYVAIGDRARALTALLHTRRLLAPLSSDEFVPGSDSLSAEALRQTVQTFLEDLAA